MRNSMALITGANGWLGKNLVGSIVNGLADVQLFSEGSPNRLVRCLLLPGEDPTFLEGLGPNVEILYGNIAHADSLKEFFVDSQGATVFHCAGIVHPLRGVKQLYEVNVEGTGNVVAMSEASEIRRLIHVSSNSPIGCNPRPDHVFDENSPYNPYMNYGRSKKLAEDIVNEASNRGKIETVIIRSPWFYGPHQPDRQRLFFKMIKDGKFPLLGNGMNRRSMAYVDNICQGTLLSESVPAASGETYWIADRTPYTMNEIVETVERVLECDFGIRVAHKRLCLPSFVADIALLADKVLQGLGAYHQKIHVLSEMNKSIACSIEKAEKELGYCPKVDLEVGVRRSLEWMRESAIEL